MADQKLGTLYYEITGDASDLNKSVSTATKNVSSLGTAGTKMGSLLKAAFSVAAVAGVAKLSKSLITAASNAEETQNKFDVVFSSVGDEAATAAAELSSAYGLSSTAAKTLLSDTGDLLTGFGLTAESALDLSVQTNQLAVDLASFTNAQGGAEAVSAALTSAYTGERDSLKSYGIVISEAMVQAQLLEQEKEGLVFASDAEAQSYATLTLALEQSTNAQGDFQRSSASFANQLRVAQANIDDLQVSLGSDLLPIANYGVTIFNDFAEKALDVAESINDFVTSAEGAATIGDAIGKIAGSIAVLGSIGGTALDGLKEGFDGVLDPIKSLKTETNDTGASFSVFGTVAASLSAALEIVGGVVGVLVNNLVVLGKAFQSVGDLGSAAMARLKGDISKEEFRESLSGVGDAFKELGSELVDEYAEFGGTVVNAVTGFREASETAAAGAAEAYQTAYTNAATTVESALLNAGTSTTEQAAATVEAQGEAQTAIEGTGDAMNDFNQKVEDSEEALVSWADFFNSQLETLTNTGMTSLLSGMDSVGEALYNGELSWGTWASAGLNALSSVLSALGAELAARAVAALLLGNIAGAAVASAGSAAAYVASGVASAAAASFEQGGTVPINPNVSPTGDKTLIAVNGGETITPADESTGTMQFMIYLDGNKIADNTVNKYINKRKYLIKTGSVV